MDLTRIVYDICRYYADDQLDVSSELRVKVQGIVRARNYEQLSSCSCYFDPAFHGINEFRFLRQVEAFFKKNALFAIPEDCANAARENFFSGETQCYHNNLKLEFLYTRRHQLDADLAYRIRKMEHFISRVLGSPERFIKEIPTLLKVTSGATASSPRAKSLPPLKLKMKVFCTRGAAPFIRAMYKYLGFDEPVLQFVETNRVETVPKNWKTDRTIACEPEGNLPFQLAFDGYAKGRLRKIGIDLRDQSRNQRLALESSVTEEFVTVDMKNASGTICYNAVAWLLHPDWFKILDQLRSPKYRGSCGEGTYHMFSSMGNGSTFALETLIFAAACHAAGSRKYSVYGDDIIIEPEYYEKFLQLVDFFGFTVNKEKTFTSGPFRESCGMDAYDGVNVTPVYIRNICLRKASLCHLVNTLVPLSHPGGRLANYLEKVVRDEKLPLTPYCENTMAGVWVYPDTARLFGVLTYKRRKWCMHAKAYQPVTRIRSFRFYRGYYLWHLSKLGSVMYAGPWEPGSKPSKADETSWVPIFTHKYERRWVGWQPPSGGYPFHLHWWDMQVTRTLPVTCSSGDIK